MNESKTQNLKSLLIERKNIFIESLAGCGKTHLSVKLAQLSHEMDRKYHAICYTNKAVESITAKLHFEEGREKISTLHALFWRIIQKEKSLSKNVEAIKEAFKKNREKIEKTLNSSPIKFTEEDLFFKADESEDLDSDEDEELETEPEEDTEIKDLTHAFNTIIQLFVTEFDKLKEHIDIDVLLIDEYQDISSIILVGVEFLIKHVIEEGGQVIVAGDSYQSIFETNNSLENVKNQFPPDSFVKIELTESFRFANLDIPRFVNGFYEKNYLPRKYSIKNESQFSNNVQIYIEQHKTLACQRLYHLSETYKQKGKSFRIIARTNKELLFYVKTLVDYKLVKQGEANENVLEKYHLSSIHSYKGNEADVIFFLNTAYCSNPVRTTNIETEIHVFNVAITRAKEQLIIISSFPKEQVLSNYKEGTYTLFDYQGDSFHKKFKTINSLNMFYLTPFDPEQIDINKEDRHKNGFRARNIIQFELRKEDEDIPEDRLYENNKNKFKSLFTKLNPHMPLLLENSKKSMIDSIIIAIPYSVQPFTPYEKNTIEKRSQYETNTRIKLEENVSYFIHRRRGVLVFDFIHLTEFKRAGLTDPEIMEFIFETIYNYFNYQIDPVLIKSCNVKRLDLCKIFRFDDVQNTLRTFYYFLKFAKGHFSNYAEIAYKSYILFQADVEKTNEKITKAKRTISVYRPKYKFEDPITDATDNDVKIEIRRNWAKDTFRNADYGDTILACRIGDLLDLNTGRQDFFHVDILGHPCSIETTTDLYKTLFEEEFKFINRILFYKQGYVSDRTRERNEIFSYEDIIKIWESGGEIPSRDKQKYFIWYMRLLPINLKYNLYCEIITFSPFFMEMDEDKIFEIIEEAKKKYFIESTLTQPELFQ